jgi:hypothetical protein
MAKSKEILRKIDEIVWKETGEFQYGVAVRALHEKLECGHVIPIRQGHFGPSKAKRRRCDACLGLISQMRPDPKGS